MYQEVSGKADLKLKTVHANMSDGAVLVCTARTLSETADFINVYNASDKKINGIVVCVEDVIDGYDNYLRDFFGLPEDFAIEIVKGIGNIKKVEHIYNIARRKAISGTQFIITDNLTTEEAAKLEGTLDEGSLMDQDAYVTIRQHKENLPFFMSSIFHEELSKRVGTFTTGDANNIMTERFDLEIFEVYRDQI